MNSRKIFIDELSKLARIDKRVILIIADVGFSYTEDFAKEFPDQYLNVGVTEQSMMGIAAGMALSGMKPYVYTMVPFVLARPYEQVRNDIVKHGADVKLIAVRGSEHYKFLGFSHNIDDSDEIKLLESLGIDWLWPASEEALVDWMQNTYQESKPNYIRL
jgi:transketolase